MMDDRPPCRVADEAPPGRTATPEVRRAADTLRLLSAPLRLRILATLAEGAPSVAELGSAFGLRQAEASRQLSLLRLAGLVEGTWAGNRKHYRLTESGSGLLASIGRIVS